MKSTAQSIMMMEDYTDSLEAAQKLQVDSEKDFIEENITFIFADGSKIEFCGVSRSKSIVC